MMGERKARNLSMDTKEGNRKWGLIWERKEVKMLKRATDIQRRAKKLECPFIVNSCLEF